MDTFPLIKLSDPIYTYNKDIISYGIALHSLDTGKWLMVQRKHSISLVRLVRGKYFPAEIPELIEYMPLCERIMFKDAIRSKREFRLLVNSIAGDSNARYVHFSWSLIRTSKRILDSALERCDDVRTRLGWLWPKGQPENNETEFSTACREFYEETEIKFEEYPHFICADSIEYRTYRNGINFYTKCWIVVVDIEIDIPDLDKSDAEIGGRAWMTSTDIIDDIESMSRGCFESIVDVLNSSL